MRQFSLVRLSSPAHHLIPNIPRINWDVRSLAILKRTLENERKKKKDLKGLQSERTHERNPLSSLNSRPEFRNQKKVESRVRGRERKCINEEAVTITHESVSLRLWDLTLHCTMGCCIFTLSLGHIARRSGHILWGEMEASFFSAAYTCLCWEEKTTLLLLLRICSRLFPPLFRLYQSPFRLLRSSIFHWHQAMCNIDGDKIWLLPFPPSLPMHAFVGWVVVGTVFRTFGPWQIKNHGDRQWWYATN